MTLTQQSREMAIILAVSLPFFTVVLLAAFVLRHGSLPQFFPL